MLMQWFGDLATWWNSLPPDMVFLFALPFVVAAGGLLAHAWRQRRGEE